MDVLQSSITEWFFLVEDGQADGVILMLFHILICVFVLLLELCLCLFLLQDY